eukprot:scpid31645/ scgid10381/ Cholinesterase; Acylcholine acylhydrolase; Butyrylcholine esterase; Choline esterase II; Pseudocholinesterase
MSQSLGCRPRQLMLAVALLLLTQWSGLAESQSEEIISTTVVNTVYGPVLGEITRISAPDIPSTLLKRFRGIPFAAPPLGELRFAPPQPPQKWSTVRDTTQYGPSCIQNVGAQRITSGTSEDCLTLNIYSPVSNFTTDTFPVMVWIYGGSYRDGSSVLYDGSVLAALGKVVVVTINYRLGAFGFASSTIPDKISGNMGFMDQQMALRWVNQNIETFSGDVAQVTIFGESAGAGSVSLHLISPKSQSLFRRAISESGSMLSPWAVQNAADLTLSVQALAQGLQCLTPGLYVDVTCLRNKTAEEILTAQNVIYDFWKKTNRQLPFTPVIDGAVLPLAPDLALPAGDFMPLEVLSGVNQNEYGLFAAYAIAARNPPVPSINSTEFNASLSSFTNLGYWGFPPAGLSKAVHDVINFEYTDWEDPNSGEARLQSSITAGSDFNFVCPLQQQADQWSKARFAALGAKLYMYQFSHKDGTFPDWVGVPHAAELPYVFGEVLMTNYLAKPLTGQLYYVTEDDRNVSLTMISIWSAFAHTGDPSNGLIETGANFTTWPVFNSTTRPYVDISINPSQGSFLHNEKCQMLAQLTPKLIKYCRTDPGPNSPLTRGTEAPPPEQPCSSKSQAYFYATIILAIVAAMFLVEIVFLSFRVHDAKRRAREYDVRKGLMSD